MQLDLSYLSAACAADILFLASLGMRAKQSGADEYESPLGDLTVVQTTHVRGAETAVPGPLPVNATAGLVQPIESGGTDAEPEKPKRGRPRKDKAAAAAPATTEPVIETGSSALDDLLGNPTLPPAPAPAPVVAPPVVAPPQAEATMVEVEQAIRAFVAVKGKPQALSIIGRFDGAASVVQIPAARRRELIAVLQAEMG